MTFLKTLIGGRLRSRLAFERVANHHPKKVTENCPRVLPFSGGLMFPRRAALARREAAEQEVSGRGRLGCRVDGLIHGV